MGGFVLQKFDGDIAERRVRQIARNVGEVARRKSGFAIFQFHRGWGLAFDFIRKIRRPNRDLDVIVVMDVHQCGIMRGNFDLEYADVLVFERQVMMLLSCDLDFRCLLCRQSQRGY